MVLGSVTDFLFGTGAQEAAGDVEALYRGIRSPTYDQLYYQLEQAVQAGELTPEQAQNILQGQTELYNIVEDPALRQAQVEALQELEQIVEARGADPILRAQLGRIQDQVASQSRGAREAVMAGARARGVGGSDLATVNQLLAQQQAITQGAQRSREEAAIAEQRRLNALTQMAQLGGQIRQADLAKAERAASSQDLINQFNIQNQLATQRQNIDAINRAREQNLAEKQRISEQNVATRNLQRAMPGQIRQQMFSNQLQQAGGLGTAIGGRGAAEQASSDRGAQLLGTLITAGAMFSDRNAKTDIQNFDPSRFLDELTGYKYKYANSAMGAGPQVGVMAQDLQKVAPQAVGTAPNGMKTIDYNKMGGTMLAALAGLANRVDELEKEKKNA